jgi:hypothetical protein
MHYNYTSIHQSIIHLSSSLIIVLLYGCLQNISLIVIIIMSKLPRSQFNHIIIITFHYHFHHIIIITFCHQSCSTSRFAFHHIILSLSSSNRWWWQNKWYSDDENMMMAGNKWWWGHRLMKINLSTIFSACIYKNILIIIFYS